jgi:nitroreductase|tara:strand:- start:36014 stop:36574 length:561 start_codon:yes stop_codon:yes gene_type:complete
MDALSALHGRVSSPRLTEPAPQGDILENIKKAAFRAADHGRMRPWRFLVLDGLGLIRLGDLLVKSAEANGEVLTDKGRERIVGRPTKRAPMIIVAIASPRENAKVPEIEQIISTGAAVQNMINAAYAQGVGTIWRTGDAAYDGIVMKGLGLSDSERIVGFLYLGTAQGKVPEAPQIEPNEYFQSWF